MIKCFDNWNEYDDVHEGSGRSEKIWLKNPLNGQIGLFKYKKDTGTKDHLSEKIASDIGALIGIRCANVDIGTYLSNEGSMSYLINQEGEVLIEGISLINKYYPHYNAEMMYDNSLNEHYSFQMLKRSVEEYGFLGDLLRMLVFDFLIGNSDRHQNNWAIIRKREGGYCFSPLYDNSSSLCCYLLEEKIGSYLNNGARLNSIVRTNSKSIVRIEPTEKKRPKHELVLGHILEYHRDKVISLINMISTRITNDSISGLLSAYPAGVLSDRRKQLITLFLMEKVKLMSLIAEGEEA